MTTEPSTATDSRELDQLREFVSRVRAACATPPVDDFADGSLILVNEWHVYDKTDGQWYQTNIAHATDDGLSLAAVLNYDNPKRFEPLLTASELLAMLRAVGLDKQEGTTTP